MGRPPRVQLAAGIYHVTTRGNRGQPIVLDHGDPWRFFDLLERVVGECGWQCYAYCLMTNHYHLLIRTPEANISAGMHRLNGQYAKTFNRIHRFAGHLFERRFHAVLVDSDSQLVEVVRYVALNPVRAGLCSHPAEWSWGSYAATAGHRAAPSFLVVDWLLSHFASDPDAARARFRRFVTDRLDEARMAAAA